MLCLSWVLDGFEFHAHRSFEKDTVAAEGARRRRSGACCTRILLRRIRRSVSKGHRHLSETFNEPDVRFRREADMHVLEMTASF